MLLRLDQRSTPSIICQTRVKAVSTMRRRHLLPLPKSQIHPNTPSTTYLGILSPLPRSQIHPNMPLITCRAMDQDHRRQPLCACFRDATPSVCSTCDQIETKTRTYPSRPSLRNMPLTICQLGLFPPQKRPLYNHVPN